MNISDIVITSLETIQCYDVSNGAYLFTLDELQNATISQTEEKTELTGKKGRKLNTMKRNKAVTVSGSNGMVSFGLLAAQIGLDSTDLASTAKARTEVQWYDYLTVTNDLTSTPKTSSATTSYVAHGTAGSEIQELWVKNGAALGTKLTQVASLTAAGQFTYDPSTKKLNFYINGSTPSLADGTELFVVYKRQIAAEVLVNSSDKYSSKVKMYIDAIGEDKCSNEYHVQFYIPRADFSGEFSFEMGDNQTIHSFEADALSTTSGCGSSASTDNYFWTCTIFGVDQADVADANG